MQGTKRKKSFLKILLLPQVIFILYFISVPKAHQVEIIKNNIPHSAQNLEMLCSYFAVHHYRFKGYVDSQPVGGGRPFNAFRGIRYARPPVGSLRFKDPEFFPYENLMNEVDAKEDGSVCPQLDIMNMKQGLKVI